MTNNITIEDFAKLEIRIGKVIEASEVEGSEKLIRCVVDFGSAKQNSDSLTKNYKESGGLGKRVIFSGIKKWYKPEELIGKFLPYVVNLEPRKIFGEESQGMLLAAAPEDEDGESGAVLLVSSDEVAPGTKVI
jgi:tRNA-binding EMAP/Myf-like protein